MLSEDVKNKRRVNDGFLITQDSCPVEFHRLFCFHSVAGRSHVRPAEKPYVERGPAAAQTPSTPPQQQSRPDLDQNSAPDSSPELSPPRQSRDLTPGEVSPPRPGGGHRPAQDPPPPPPVVLSPQTPRAAEAVMTPASPEPSPLSSSSGSSSSSCSGSGSGSGSGGIPRDSYGPAGSIGSYGSPPAGLVSETRRWLEMGLQVDQMPTPQLFPPAPARPPKPDSLRAPPAETSPPPPPPAPASPPPPPPPPAVAESSSASEESLDQVPSREVASAALLQLDRLVSGPEREGSPPPPPPPPGQEGADGLWGFQQEDPRDVPEEAMTGADVEHLQVRLSGRAVWGIVSLMTLVC